MNARHACSSIIPLCSHIIKKFSILAKTVQHTHEQVSVCVRFVGCTGGRATLREEFLVFLRASEHIGENRVELF
jgi:hypothetical protein